MRILLFLPGIICLLLGLWLFLTRETREDPVWHWLFLMFGVILLLFWGMSTYRFYWA